VILQKDSNFLYYLLFHGKDTDLNFLILNSGSGFVINDFWYDIWLKRWNKSLNFFVILQKDSNFLHHLLFHGKDTDLNFLILNSGSGFVIYDFWYDIWLRRWYEKAIITSGESGVSLATFSTERSCHKETTC